MAPHPDKIHEALNKITDIINERNEALTNIIKAEWCEHCTQWHCHPCTTN